jgi:hypothetical protein
MIDAIIIIGMCLGMLFASWAVACVILKVMFKIADWIF